MDYELHQSTKLNYLFFESTRLLDALEIQLLKAQCEQERTHVLTILMFSMESPRPTGYMLTGNRSMFLNTVGSLALLYHCPEPHSPLHTMIQCYDRLPIFYIGVVAFVDPITRQAYPNANVRNSTDRMRNLFLLDMADKVTLFTLTPSPEHRDRPAIFRLKDIQPMISRSFPGSQDAGIYTSKLLRILGQHPYQCSVTECLREVLQRAHNALYGPYRTRIFRVLRTPNGFLCRRHDIARLL